MTIIFETWHTWLFCLTLDYFWKMTENNHKNLSDWNSGWLSHKFWISSFFLILSLGWTYFKFLKEKLRTQFYFLLFFPAVCIVYTTKGWADHDSRLETLRMWGWQDGWAGFHSSRREMILSLTGLTQDLFCSHHFHQHARVQWGTLIVL